MTLLTPEAYGVVSAGSASMKGEGHRLDGEQRRDVGVDRLAAGKDGVDPAKRRLGGGALRDPPQRRRQVDVDGVHGRAELEHQDVAVEGGEVDERPVERV